MLPFALASRWQTDEEEDPWHMGIAMKAGLNGKSYWINALLKPERAQPKKMHRRFEADACGLGSELVKSSFDNGQDGITRNFLRAANIVAFMTATLEEHKPPCAQLLVEQTGAKRCIVRGLCTMRQHQKMGLGTLLMRTLLTRVVAPGVVVEVHVDAFDPNREALCAWYQKLGFAPANPPVADCAHRFETTAAAAY